MQESVLNKFNQWTQSLSEQDARIKIFTEIRDIPYYLVPHIDDPQEWACSILKTNKGSCSPKHYLLGAMFEKLGAPVKYVTYPFKWGVQPIKYPAQLLEAARNSPIGYHGACKIKINDKWVLVDATWDSPLKKHGFPVNEAWDGFSETKNAVVPFDEIIHDSLESRLAYVKEEKARFSDGEKAIYVKFIEGFNRWLEGLRKIRK